MTFSRDTCLLIDFDGTIVDSEPIHLKANSEAFAAFGHRMDVDEYYRHWSLLGEGPSGEISRHNLTHIEEKTVRNLGRTAFARLIQSEPIPLLPGAREFLDFITRLNLRAVIASNTPSDFIRIMMRRAGLDDCPIPVIGGRDGLRGKPFPDIFLDAASRLGALPSNCIAVEDTLKGLNAARAAGMPCLVVPCFRYPPADYTGAVEVFTNLHQIVDWMKENML